MTIKISDLKQKEVRRTVTILLENGEVEKINIYNPTGEKRQEVLNLMNEYSEKEGENTSQELLKELIRKLTDLKVNKKDDIEDIISSPKGELLLVLREINEIKTELEYEFWVQKIMEINQATINILSARAIEKSNHLYELAQELETKNQNISELEEKLDNTLEG